MQAQPSKDDKQTEEEKNAAQEALLQKASSNKDSSQSASLSESSSTDPHHQDVEQVATVTEPDDIDNQNAEGRNGKTELGNSLNYP